MPTLRTLSAAQRARFPEFVEKWTRIGLCTEPADRLRAEAGIRLTYAAANLPPPARIVWCASPLTMYITRRMAEQLLTQGKMKSVGASVWESVGESVFGQHEAGWLGFYDYFRKVCGFVKPTAPLEGLWCTAHACGWWLPREQICWVSERHTILHRDVQGRLHSEYGLACGYPDGWGVYALHGVRMEPWMVTTPAERMNVVEFVNVKNADQRRELIRKVGIERWMQQVGATTLHQRGDYALVEVQVNGRSCRYLKMKNPSVGCWHVEGVPNEINSVEAALAWRNQDEEVTEVLT